LLKTWLLSGDISIQYRVYRDLEGAQASVLKSLQTQISQTGWGKQYVDAFHPESGWWDGVYSPKWTSTHYTLMNLMTLGIEPMTECFQVGATQLLNAMWTNEGRVNRYRYQDMCVSAMLLSIASYGHLTSPKINEIVDYILSHQFFDGGWNCNWQKGAIHSSLHTTISVLEAFRKVMQSEHPYRFNEIVRASEQGREFILRKKFFRSERTNEVILPVFLLNHDPVTWHYDVLRGLEYFASVHAPYDERMEEALTLLLMKQKSDHTWSHCSPYSGRYYFHQEKTGAPSRCVTVRVLKVLKEYRNSFYQEIYR